MKGGSKLAYFIYKSNALYESFFVRTELTRAMKDLQLMKKVKFTLESLYIEVTAEIAALTAAIMPAIRHHGLNDIPDELLSHILTLDVYQHDNKKARKAYGKTQKNVVPERPRQLGSVSKRFRSVVFATPGCWSWIDEDTPSHRQMMFKELPVDMKVTLDKNASHLDQYKERIRHLEVHGNDRSLVELDFPSLNSLVLHGCGENILNWSLYQLTSLTCSIIPPPNAFPLLTHCVLDLPYRYAEDIGGRLLHLEPSFEDLANFLLSTSTLQYLSIPIDTRTLYNWTNKTIPLPNLERLHVKCNRLHKSFLEVFDCPKLKAVDMLLASFASDEPFTFREGFLDGTLSYKSFNVPSVANLTIQNAGKAFCVQLADIHRTFPRLRRLIVDGDFRVQVSRPNVEDHGDDISLDQLASVYIRVPLIDRYDNWTRLISAFKWYKKKGVKLRHLEVRDGMREEQMPNQCIFKKMATLFPTTVVRLDDYKWIRRARS